MKLSFYELEKLSEEERTALYTRTESDLTYYIERVEPIIREVERCGDEALLGYAERFDGVCLGSLRVGLSEFDRARVRLSDEVKEALLYAIEGIRSFHREQVLREYWLKEVRSGTFVGERVVAVPSVGCYVPRGKGTFPSVAMMTTIPACLAGVERVIVLTPAGEGGEVDDATLFVCEQVGVEEVYKVGGAQAVAAVAFGTESIPRVSKLVGPGSPWYMAARRLLAGTGLDVGLPAGPSESVVLADDSANSRRTALDLIIESEHGMDSSAFLVTNNRQLAEETMCFVPEYWEKMGRQRCEYSRTVLCGERGGVVLTRDFEGAVDFVNEYAPEHLLIHSQKPFDHLGKIRNAGEVLLGEDTPFTLANYLLGPNCVLPTAGMARTWSPLSVRDFVKRISIGYVTRSAYPELARHAYTLATYEGFDGHALAISALREET